MRWPLVALVWCAPLALVHAEPQPLVQTPQRVAPAPLEVAQDQPLRGVVQLALGAQHSCARRRDGSVLCWGDGSQGQRGNGERGDGPTPALVRTFDKLVAIGAGAMHTCAWTTHDVWCWGANNVYQLGVGDAENPKAVVSGLDRGKPEQSRRFGAFVALGFGDVSYAIDAAGAVTCIGHSNHCGFETGTTAITGLPPVTSVDAGDGHACAVTRAGGVYCWGRTDWGQGGSGLDHTFQSATEVEGLHDVVEIAAGGAHTCARTSKGDVYCWGLNDHGQLGDGTRTQRNRPVKLRLAHVEQIAIGGFSSCARLAGGTVSCWGAHQDVPNIYFNKLADTLVPTRLALSGVLEIAAGGAHACARLDDDTVRCWGLDSNGQLGNGTTTSSIAPVTVVAPRG